MLGGVLGAMILVNHCWSLSQSQFMVMVSHIQNYDQCTAKRQRQKIIVEQGQSLAEWVVMAGR